MKLFHPLMICYQEVKYYQSLEYEKKSAISDGISEHYRSTAILLPNFLLTVMKSQI